jgi:hypothetical protein
MGRFDLNQKISSVLALIFIFVLSFLVAWFALSVGDNIVASAPQSAIFNPAKRIPR